MQRIQVAALRFSSPTEANIILFSLRMKSILPQDPALSINKKRADKIDVNLPSKAASRSGIIEASE